MYNKFKSIIIAVTSVIIIVHSAKGQHKVWVNNANKIFNFQFNYSYIQPGGNFATLFNTINSVGFGGVYKTSKNILIAAEGNYHFGNNLKPNNILFNLTNSNGFITNNSGYEATLSMGVRGLSINAKTGYLFSVSPNNLNTGFIITLGGGWNTHKVNFATTNNDIPSLTEDKKKGYDRYTTGFALNQFVGYMHHSLNRRVNFYIGVELMQGFMYNRRKFNYDEMKVDTDMHRDNYFGLKAAWMIPIYIKTKNANDEFIFD